jgi:hypothetical protein
MTFSEPVPNPVPTPNRGPGDPGHSSLHHADPVCLHAQARIRQVALPTGRVNGKL